MIFLNFAAKYVSEIKYLTKILNKNVHPSPDFVNHPREYLEPFVCQEDLMELMLEGFTIAGLLKVDKIIN